MINARYGVAFGPSCLQYILTWLSISAGELSSRKGTCMKSSMFVGLMSAVAVAVSVFVMTPAMAQPAAPSTTQNSGGAAAVATRGQTVLTTSGRRVGRVISVNGDGSVRVAVDAPATGSARLPADTLSAQGDSLVTSLTIREILASSR